MDETELVRELKEAQADVRAARAAPARRRKAVTQALAAGMTKYKIAAVLGVRGPTVDAIIESAERKQAQPEGE